MKANVAPVVLACACVLALAASCGGRDPSVDATPAVASFIALQSDFQGFEAWQSYAIEDSNVDAVHTGPSRTVYINELPGEGASSFPTGTIIVKTGAGGEVTGETGDEIHAMVKRGRFNDSGARGWEWFELAKNEEDDVIIVWRGLEPPDGEGYGCSPGIACDESIVSCNSCHVAVIDNDYVHAIALR